MLFKKLIIKANLLIIKQIDNINVLKKSGKKTRPLSIIMLFNLLFFYNYKSHNGN